MIVRQARESRLLIAQPDHARLAGRIMERSVALAAHPRREAILRAVAAHDDGWTEEDAALTVNPESGDIVDFVALPTGRLHDVWRRDVARLAGVPWAAALVAQHALTVYERHRGKPEWTPFFAEMAAGRDAALRASAGSLADLESDYAFLRLGDLISLAFCTGQTDEVRYREWTVRRSGDRIVVSPDPFGGAVVPIEVAAREIPQRPYRSDAELRDAIAGAATTILRGEVAGGKG